MIDLLPDDPEEIRRLYREVRKGESWAVAQASETEFTPVADHWLGIESVLIFLLVALPTIIRSGEGIWGIFSGLVVAFACSYLFTTWAESIAFPGRTAGNDHKRLRANGPFTFGAILYARHRFKGRHAPRTSGPDTDPIDVESLEVLEPVARYVAQPILQRARRESADREGEANGHVAWVATLRRRVAELEIEYAEETDPVWREAIEVRKREIEAEVLAEEENWNRRREARVRVQQEADEIEELLVRLGRRRRLLDEFGRSRRSVAEEVHPDNGIEDLRSRLRSLGESLSVRDSGTDRLRAEIEMGKLEGRWPTR